jgi:hypothetical protein
MYVSVSTFDDWSHSDDLHCITHRQLLPQFNNDLLEKRRQRDWKAEAGGS